LLGSGYFSGVDNRSE